MSLQAEPIVIPNGCTDKTAEIARNLGATVIELDGEGKMTALQEGMRYLGKRALEPFVTLDADTHPIFSRLWLLSLLKARTSLPENRPAAVTGPIIFSGGPSIFSDAYRTVRDLQMHISNRNNSKNGVMRGANMLIHTRKPQVVEEILELPQIWPGYDGIIKDIVVASGGSIRRSINPGAVVVSDSSRYIGVKQRLLDGYEMTVEKFQQSYFDEAPPNSITGSQFKQLDS